AQVFERIRHRLQKVRLALVEASEPVGAKRLQDAHVDIRIVMLHKVGALQVHHTSKAVEIVLQKLLAQRRRQVGFAVVEQRRNVVLQSALASALVVEKPRLALAQHHVARLEIAIEKILAVGGEQELRQPPEIVFQVLLVEGHSGQPQKVVLEVVQIPRNRLAIEARSRIADSVIQIAPGDNLK